MGNLGLAILHIVGARLPRDPEREAASGVVNIALRLAQQQVQRGHKVTVAAIGERRGEGQWNGVVLRYLPPVSWARLRVGGRTLDLRRHLPFVLLSYEQRFDVIHGHLHNYMRWIRSSARIAHVHTSPLHRSPAVLPWSSKDVSAMLRYCDQVIAVSHAVKDQLISLAADPDRIHVVRNATDPDRFAPEHNLSGRTRLREKWGLSDTDVSILFTGAIVPEKGLLNLIGAFRHIAGRSRRVHLVVAGGSSLWGSTASRARSAEVVHYDDEVRKAINNLDDPTRVHTLGLVARSEMPAVLAAADIVCVPSVWDDPYPTVLLEAQAAGKAIVATRVGGIPEIVIDGSGLLVTSGEGHALSHALARLAEDEELRRMQGRTGLRLAAQRSWSQVADEVDSVYE